MMKIGLSLSGGGFRATVFHLGVLARLAEEGSLEKVDSLSTVSGGSLCIGLVLAANGFRWPSSTEFLRTVMPRARELLTTQDLQNALIGHVLRLPVRLFHTRADDLSLVLQARWGVTSTLQSLPEHPHWVINATCYETGQNWRFERNRMGDRVFGFTEDTDIPLGDALAASAAFPGLIGPLVLDSRGYSWFQSPDLFEHGRIRVEPNHTRLHLWDGGVGDNLGVESLHSFLGGWQRDVDMLIVSDACEALQPERYHSWKAANRMVRGIMMDQIRQLRFRSIVERHVNHSDAACYLQIGQTCADALRMTGRQEFVGQFARDCLSRDEAQRAAQVPTAISRLSSPCFERLFRHGFEVADYTLYAYQPDRFSYIGYRFARASRLAKVSPQATRAPLRKELPVMVGTRL